jgi:hypothetical protein
VLDQLTAIDHGANPDTEHAPLPRGLAGSLDLSRIGMYGRSIGGAIMSVVFDRICSRIPTAHVDQRM